MAEPVSRLVSVGGLRLHVFVWEQAGAPALVLLHGLGESADVWRPLAPRLAGEFQVLAVDLRGHGDSDWHDTYAPQEIADDIGELIGVLGLWPAAVTGTGMGGRAAALLAARQEHLPRCIVDIGASVQMYHPAEREAAEAMLAMPRVYESPEEYLRAWWALRRSLGLTWREEPPTEVARHIERSLRRLSTGGWSPKFDVDGYARYRYWSPGERSVDYHEEFHEISTPALLIRGADSPLLPPEEAAATARAIPNCRLIEVPNARHDVLADNPDGLLEAMLPFLREH
jgi:pimeloyl-ACP methyl ester carboxylesterase